MAVEPQGSLSKSAARHAARARCASLSAADREAQSAAIRQRVLSLPEMRTADAVCVYVSFRDEVDTHELVRSLLIGRRTVTIPKMFASSIDFSPRIEACEIRSWNGLSTGSFGILEPRTNDVFSGSIDVCLAPGLAFSESGDRLGYGRGYYDEFLARHPGMVVVGLAFEVQIVPELRTGPWDRRVHTIVTHQRTIRCRRW